MYMRLLEDDRWSDKFRYYCQNTSKSIVASSKRYIDTLGMFCVVLLRRASVSCKKCCNTYSQISSKF